MKTGPRKTPKRDDRYMGLAFWHASFSKDPSTQIGAVIVSRDNRILGTGYNGPPAQFNDNDLDWGRPAKYGTIIHAETNAILYAVGDLRESILYVTAPPCVRCMLEIIASGVGRIVYFPMQTSTGSMITEEELDKIKDLANKSKVVLEKYSGNLNWMRDAIENMKRLNIFT